MGVLYHYQIILSLIRSITTSKKLKYTQKYNFHCFDLNLGDHIFNVYHLLNSNYLKKFIRVNCNSPKLYNMFLDFNSVTETEIKTKYPYSFVCHRGYNIFHVCHFYFIYL